MCCPLLLTGKNPPWATAILTMEERTGIELFVHTDMGCRTIAIRLGYYHITISRKLRSSPKTGYRARTADRRARKKRELPRHYRRMAGLANV